MLLAFSEKGRNNLGTALKIIESGSIFAFLTYLSLTLKSSTIGNRCLEIKANNDIVCLFV